MHGYCGESRKAFSYTVEGLKDANDFMHFCHRNGKENMWDADAQIVNLDEVDIDNPSGLSALEREVLDHLSGRCEDVKE
jgi:hypothetical protein